MTVININKHKEKQAQKKRQESINRILKRAKKLNWSKSNKKETTHHGKNTE